jgi:hypothetical protein
MRVQIRILSAAWIFGALAFAQQRPPIPQQLTFVPDHANGIYDVGETVGWTVTPGPVEPTYSYKWTIRRNNAVVLGEGKLDLSSGRDRIEVKGEEPEMIYVAIEPTAKLVPDAAPPAEAPAPPAAGRGRGNPNGYIGGNTGRNNGLYAVGAAVAPLKLGLAAPRPGRF